MYEYIKHKIGCDNEGCENIRKSCISILDHRTVLICSNAKFEEV